MATFWEIAPRSVGHLFSLYFVYFPFSLFGFKNRIWFFIAPVPVHCFSITFNVTVNNFSVMLGRSHRFLGIYQYFGELKVSCSRTLHSDGGVRTWKPSSGAQGSTTRPPRPKQRMWPNLSYTRCTELHNQYWAKNVIKNMIRSVPYIVHCTEPDNRGCSGRCPVRPLHFDRNELYWNIWRKVQVRQCLKISCFISFFSTILKAKSNITLFIYIPFQDICEWYMKHV